MQYPPTIEIEQWLKRFAEEIGDTTESPFRVGVLARYGGKPPLYTVMIRCAEKEPIRHKLSQVLNRSFSLGGTSFALDVGEAQRIVPCTRPEASTMPEATPTRLDYDAVCTSARDNCGEGLESHTQEDRVTISFTGAIVDHSSPLAADTQRLVVSRSPPRRDTAR